MARDEIPLKGTCRNTICIIEESTKKATSYELIASSNKQRNQPLKKSGINKLYLNF